MYGSCLLYILNIYCKWLHFQFLSCGICQLLLSYSCLFSVNSFFFSFLSHCIRMHIPILTGIQTGRVSRWENGQILIKNLLWKLLFQDEGHLNGNCLFYILVIYCKDLFLQFLSRSIRIHIPILTGVQNKQTSKNAKKAHILSIWFCQVAPNCCFGNTTKKLFFSFFLMLFFYI